MKSLYTFAFAKPLLKQSEMEGFLHEFTYHVASSRNPYKNQAKWKEFRMHFFEFCCLHETLIKTKRNGCFFGMKFGTAAFFAKPLLKQMRN